MTPFRLALFAVLLGLAVGACSREEAPADADAENALLDYVPADSPYVAANLERLPEGVIDVYLQRMQPALDEMQAQLATLRADLEAARDESGNGPDTSPPSRLALAVLSELDGNLSRAGLASLGLDILSHKVVYGMGAFPVVRLGLSDADLLRATIQRVLEKAEIPALEQTFQGVGFWRVVAEDRGDVPLGLYLSVLDDHLAAGLLPPAFEAETLPAFLGLATPADSTVRGRLSSLNADQGYTAFGSGMLDLHLLADQFLKADSLTARALAATGEFDPASISADCIGEIHEIIDNAPRMTMGTRELSTEAIAYEYRVESTAALAGQLSGLVARMPEAIAHSDRLLELSFGMRLGAARDFLREKAAAIVDDPYACEHLEDINSRAAQSLAQLDQPMPPFFNNFRGLRVALNEITPGRSQLPANARGHMALHVEQPEMFLGMAQMFLPDLSSLALTPGGDPVQIPASLIPVPDVTAFAAMSDNAIGLAVGAGEEAGLKAFLDRPPGPKDTFLSLSYDSAAYLEYTRQLSPPSWGGDGDDPAQAVQAIATAAREAFSKTADRSMTTLRFGPDGLAIDGRMTFKPLASQ